MKKIKIHNSFSSLTISTLGAEIISWTQSNKELIYNEKKDWNRSAPVLFPYIGATKSPNRARHGLVRDLEFSIVEQGNDYIKLQLNLKAIWKNVELTVFYKLDKEKLITNFSIINQGAKTIDFKLGWHPAFNLAQDISNYNIKPTMNSYQLSKKGLITGEKIKFNNTLLNNDYFQRHDTIIFDQINDVILKSDKQEIKMKSNFDVLGIWKPPCANFICIEPWSNLPENIDEKLDKFSKIKPKEKLKYKVETSIKWL